MKSTEPPTPTLTPSNSRARCVNEISTGYNRQGSNRVIVVEPMAGVDETLVEVAEAEEVTGTGVEVTLMQNG